MGTCYVNCVFATVGITYLVGICYIGRYLLPILRICYSRKYGGVGICYERWVFTTVANMEVSICNLTCVIDTVASTEE